MAAEPMESIAAMPIRRLTAVLLADVVGYSRMMSRDEDATHERVTRYMRELIDPTVAKYGGRFVRSVGDGMLVEFPSALDAVRCALDMQRGLAELQADEPNRIQLRIGINTGDVLADGRDIYGNSVNITARLEALAAPGTVRVSQSIYDQTRGQPDLFFVDLGMHRVKNIDYPIHVFEVSYEPIRVPFLTRFLAHRTGLTIAGTIGTIALASVAGLLTFGEQQKVVARTNSIIVLPFRNVDGNPTDDYLADAITDDLTTELSRLRRAWVIASATALTYKGKPINVQQVGREVGVRYALEGTVKRAGPVVRVNAQLIDTESGTSLWADRFQYETSSLLALQDAVTSRIASSLSDRVIKASSRHEVGNLAADGNPLDQRLRALAAITGAPTPEKTLETRRYAESAVQADPQDARSWAILAFWLMSDYLNGWNNAGLEEVKRAEEAADKAMALDPATALAHCARGLIRRVRGDHEGALAAFDEAIRHDPNLAIAHAQRANELAFLGRARDALAAAEEATRLSPKDPSAGIFYWVRGRAYFVLGDYPNAVKWLEESVRQRPNLWFPRAWLIAAYALNGQDAEARAAREKYEDAFPQRDLARITSMYSEDKQYKNTKIQGPYSELFKGLRQAGLK